MPRPLAFPWNCRTTPYSIYDIFRFSSMNRTFPTCHNAAQWEVEDQGANTVGHRLPTFAGDDSSYGRRILSRTAKPAVFECGSLPLAVVEKERTGRLARMACQRARHSSVHRLAGRTVAHVLSARRFNGSVGTILCAAAIRCLNSLAATPIDDHSYLTKAIPPYWAELIELGQKEQAMDFLLKLTRNAAEPYLDEIREMIKETADIKARVRSVFEERGTEKDKFVYAAFANVADRRLVLPPSESPTKRLLRSNSCEASRPPRR